VKRVLYRWAKRAYVLWISKLRRRLDHPI